MKTLRPISTLAALALILTATTMNVAQAAELAGPGLYIASAVIEPVGMRQKGSVAGMPCSDLFGNSLVSTRKVCMSGY